MNLHKHQLYLEEKKTPNHLKSGQQFHRINTEDKSVIMKFSPDSYYIHSYHASHISTLSISIPENLYNLNACNKTFLPLRLCNSMSAGFVCQLVMCTTDTKCAENLPLLYHICIDS